MKKLSFREVQEASYTVLKRIDTICREHSWIYFLAYGSLIGAYREGGIIPWDDDIDIMMPRPDFDRFKAYFIEHSHELMPLKIFDHSVNKDYPHVIPRISDTRYKLIFDNEKDYGIGVFVDVYPLDGVGNDRKVAERFCRKMKRLASLCFLTGRKKFGVDNTRSKAKMLLKIPAYAWAKILGNDHYVDKINKLVQKYDYNDSRYVAVSSWLAGGNPDVFEKKIFKPTTVHFENGEFGSFVGYDEFLKITYGDYMTPPPENDRKTNHTYDAYYIGE